MRNSLKKSLLEDEFEGGELNAANLMSLNDSRGPDDNMSKSFLSKSMHDETSTEIEGFSEFDKYGSLFKDLTKRHYMSTDNFDVIQIIISNASKFAVAIMTEEDNTFELRAYNLDK